MNQYEAETSGGEYAPAYRKTVESFYMGMTAQSYDALADADKPKYGYLAPALGSALHRNSTAAAYGSDVFYFKKDRLEGRTAWMPGDSLDQYNSVYGAGDRHPLWLKRFIDWKDKDLLLLHLKAFDNVPTELSR